MSRPALRGARRTRVYDCNYNAGQNYYKPTIDNLDRKLYGRPLLSERFESPKPAPPSLFSPARETTTPFNDEPLSNARRRAERVITEDAFFDSRGARVPKNTIGEAIREFDDEFQSTINKIRASKKAATYTNAADADFDDSVDTFKRRNRTEFKSQLDNGVSHAANTIRKSAYKITSRREEEVQEPVSIAKWTAVSSTNVDDSGAALRAKATKARLDDIESEMFERTEKQLAREKRSQALKKFIANIDNELDD